MQENNYESVKNSISARNSKLTENCREATLNYQWQIHHHLLISKLKNKYYTIKQGILNIVVQKLAIFGIGKFSAWRGKYTAKQVEDALEDLRTHPDKYGVDNIETSIKLSKYGQKLSDIGEILENGLVKGKYSGRIFNPDNAGGLILNLNWLDTEITQAGVDQIKIHLARFGKSSQNEKAILRLEDILKKKIKLTEYDKIFYTHELQEFERYRSLGVKNGINEPEIWENCHSATLEDFKINEKTTSVYHPDTEPSIEELLKEYD